MEDKKIEKRLDILEKELNRIKKLYEKSLHYKVIDPEISLSQARKSAEAICKQIYIIEGLEKNSKPADKMMLNELIQALTRKKVIPRHIVMPLGTIQAFGNFAAHDQGEDTDYITEDYIKPCLQALTTLVLWYFHDYHQKEFSTVAKTQNNTCTNCSEKVDLDWDVCPYCETALRLKCPQCSYDINEKMKICPKCRETLININKTKASNEKRKSAIRDEDKAIEIIDDIKKKNDISSENSFDVYNDTDSKLQIQPVKENGTLCIKFLEGIWKTKEYGGIDCIKVIDNRLIWPYCLRGDNELNGYYYNFRFLDDFIIAQFKWAHANHSGFIITGSTPSTQNPGVVNSSRTGFIILKIIGNNMLDGGWYDPISWNLSITESPLLFSSNDIEEIKNSYNIVRRYNPITLMRQTGKEYPEWALNFFEKERNIDDDSNENPSVKHSIKENKIEDRTFTEIIADIEFIYISGGIFLMGAENEHPVHEVQINGFYLSKYPITQGQWEKIMNHNPSRSSRGSSYPVDSVSWNNVQQFIKKFGTMNKSKYNFRLPTEAEWEYAARSGGNKEIYAGGNEIDYFAWYNENSEGCTHLVGLKKANGFGLYDMSGNVFEWCQDYYSIDAYKKLASKNPVNNVESPYRVFRGGGWSSMKNHVRCCERSYGFPNDIGNALGFRLVMELIND